MAIYTEVSTTETGKLPYFVFTILDNPSTPVQGSDPRLIPAESTDTWNCTDCGNDAPFFLPFKDADPVYFQFRTNTVNDTSVNDLVEDFVLDECATLADVDGAYFTTNWLLSALSVELVDACTDSTVTLDCDPFNEVFFGIALDVDQSRALGYIPNSISNTAANMSFFGYVYFKCAPDSNWPDSWYLRVTFDNGTAVPLEYITQTYKRVTACDETVTIKSEYTYEDCFGQYYGLPYRCFWSWYETDPNIPPSGCYSPVSWSGNCGPRIRTPRYQNFVRLPASLEANQYEITTENYSSIFGATGSQINTSYRTIYPGLPAQVADMLASIHAGRKVYVNGAHVAAEGFAKDNEQGSQWWITTNYISNCNLYNFCGDC